MIKLSKSRKTPEMAADKSPGGAQVLFLPVGKLGTAMPDNAAGVVVAGQRPAQVTEPVFFDKSEPFRGLMLVDLAEAEGITDAELADENRKSSFKTFLRPIPQPFGMGRGIEM